MIYRIEAWISLAGIRVLVGEMVCEIEPDGRGRGAFRYTSSYLSKPGAFALDPISLPLRIYILAALLMKSEPGVPGRSGSKENSYGRYNRARHDTAERFKRKWRHLEKRIRTMEDKVTSREFDWNSRFHG